jgi:hypothetical protein
MKEDIKEYMKAEFIEYLDIQARNKDFFENFKNIMVYDGHDKDEVEDFIIDLYVAISKAIENIDKI